MKWVLSSSEGKIIGFYKCPRCENETQLATFFSKKNKTQEKENKLVAD